MAATTTKDKYSSKPEGKTTKYYKVALFIKAPPFKDRYAKPVNAQEIGIGLEGAIADIWYEQRLESQIEVEEITEAVYTKGL